MVNKDNISEQEKLGFSIKEATRLTGVCRTTLYEAIKAGKLRYFQVGRRVLFSREHLSEFLQSHEQRAA
jgi:excisionase family DNA binding protein